MPLSSQRSLNWVLGEPFLLQSKIQRTCNSNPFLTTLLFVNVKGLFPGYADACEGLKWDYCFDDYLYAQIEVDGEENIYLRRGSGIL